MDLEYEYDAKDRCAIGQYTIYDIYVAKTFIDLPPLIINNIDGKLILFPPMRPYKYRYALMHFYY